MKQSTWPIIEISGAGVLHVRSSELVKTEQAQKQINAFERLKQSGRI